ncbi:MAG: tetratricopeptide repeat protein [Candidatus Coatesbacteria bacterium]|nr:tetratricopeptide repeat protein [Candidatus Coatesbacteria bacterium]
MRGIFRHGILVLLPFSLAVSLFAQENYDLANRLFAQAQFAEAIEAYQKSLRDEDVDIAAHSRYMLATCFERLWDTDRADENYRLVWQLFPRSQWADDALLQVADHLVKGTDIEDVKAAKSYLLKLQGIYPQSDLIPESLCLLGEINIRLREYDEGVRNLTEVLDKYADSGFSPRAHFALGRLYSDEQNPLRDLERAVDEYGLVIEEAPKSEFAPWAYYSIGNVLREQKKWAYARPYFQTVIERYEGSFCAEAAQPMLVLSQVERDHFLRGGESFEQLLAMINQSHDATSSSKDVIASARPVQVMALEIVADEAYSDESRAIAIYKGDVRVSAGKMRVFADNVVCELRNQLLRASGESTRVQFSSEFVLDCKEFTFDIKNQKGVASGGVRYVESLPDAPNSTSVKMDVKTVKNLTFEIKDGGALSLSVQE